MLENIIAYPGKLNVTLLGIILTGIKWRVLGNSAILFPVFNFNSHDKYRPIRLWGS